MPDEEMEMTVDFSPAGFGEDIDIDLDFPTGQPDEDMDLGDFDRAHDIQNFGSDTRDEMMAEGDDSSYGMIDAIDIDHNASAAAGNDIDIDLEHVVESIWQNPIHPVDFNPDTEINCLDDATGEVVEAEKDDIEAGMWQSLAETNAGAAEAIGHINEASVDIVSGESGPHEHPRPEEFPPARGETPGYSTTTSYDAGNRVSPKIANLEEESKHSKDVKSLTGDEITEVMTQVSDKPSVAEQDEHKTSKLDDAPDSKPDSADFQLEDSYNQLEPHYPDDIVGIGPDNAYESHMSHELEQLEHPGSIRSSDVQDDQADALQPEEADQSADDASEYHQGAEPYIESTNDQTSTHDDAPEYQSGAEPYIETTNDLVSSTHGDAPAHHGAESFVESTNDQNDADDDAPQAGSHELHRRPNSQPVANSPSLDLEGHQGKVVTDADTESSAIEVSDRDDPIELADYYGVYISYGKTDYYLFANGEDDDPNQYFLSDKSALNIPLSQFLGSLREIISDEISPLDELVMHVDGLGLEFSESTSLDFLGKFTFGDLVILYDKLVKNEQTESSPPLYTYLTMKPNCNRRMMALGDSANAGRGLSEVALYRNSPSIDDWRGSDLGSPHTDISIGGDYNDGENSDYLQENDEEGNLLSDGERKAPQVTATTPSGPTPTRHEQNDEFDHASEQDLEDNVAYAADNDQEVSASKQDDATIESSVFQSQEAGGQEQQPSSNLPENGDPELPAPTATLINSSAEAPNSDNTSVTATLDGEDHDEIDYSDEGDNNNHDEFGESNSQKKVTGTELDVGVSVDDEITWESENDDDEDKNEARGGSAKDTVQVLPVSGKRGRSDSDALDGTGNENDSKRRRS
ncbi:hypothetical protein GGS21DRAFT_200726 [Xylaria nigripes]|nr:hypothetical protein GGS21DRAFT_200726 [Xylaria nigripes]